MPGTLIFPSQPFEPAVVDYEFTAQFEAARDAGLVCALINQDRMDAGDFDKAAARLNEHSGEVVYRGWMLTDDAYARLNGALEAKGLQLLNSPGQYTHCHHLPGSYGMIEDCTPRSVWTEGPQPPPLDEIMSLLSPFGDKPIIVKDYVKSQKHDWEEACFIPSAADRAAVGRVVGRFVELQGGQVAGGLVFREFLELESVGRHSKSGMPLTREYRIFYLDGAPLVWGPYWDEGEYRSEAPSVGDFADIARRIDSRFFTMDIARKTDGEWIVIELGDGQVAGLLGTIAPDAFYGALAERLG